MAERFPLPDDVDRWLTQFYLQGSRVSPNRSPEAIEAKDAYFFLSTCARRLCSFFLRQSLQVNHVQFKYFQYFLAPPSAYQAQRLNGYLGTIVHYRTRFLIFF